MIQATPDPKKNLRTLHFHPFSTSIKTQKYQQKRPRNIQSLARKSSSPAGPKSPLQAALHQHQVLQALVGSEPAGGVQPENLSTYQPEPGIMLCMKQVGVFAMVWNLYFGPTGLFSFMLDIMA